MKVRSIVPYYGGKARMAPLIAEMLDYDNTDIYVEPFGGGCRVLLNKPRHKIECYNDYGEGICAVMRVMSNPDTAREFIERLGETEYSEEEFNRAKALYDACENDPEELSRRKLIQILRQPKGHGIKRVTAQLLLSAQEISSHDPALAEFTVWQKNNPDLWKEFSAEYEVWYGLFQRKLQQGYLERPRDLYDRPVSDMELAVATYVTFIQSHDAMGQYWSRHRYKDNEAYYKHMIDLYECAERMEGVQVYQIDAMNFFRWGGDGGQITEWLNNPRVMMYLDPSYISPEWERKALEGINIAEESSLSDAVKRNPKNLGNPYATSFSYADHEEFLRRICDAKCKMVVSNYDLALYDKYLTPERGWNRKEFHTTTGVGGKKDNKRVEILWYNY